MTDKEPAEIYKCPSLWLVAGEILNLSDRVMVMFAGRLSEPTHAAKWMPETVAPMMAGMGFSWIK